MLLNTYESQSLLCNTSVKGATTEANVYAYRGDLVLVEGEIADDAGRRLPPTAVVKQASILVKDDKITMCTGIISDMLKVPEFTNRYKKDLADGAGTSIILMPHEEGAAWQTLMDDLRLDKEDFKGQSAEDKVITMAEALADFKPNYDKMSFAAATEFVSAVTRAHRGPV